MRSRIPECRICAVSAASPVKVAALRKVPVITPLRFLVARTLIPEIRPAAP